MKSKYYRTELIESIESDIGNNSDDFILSICEMPLEKYVSSSSFMLYSRKEIKKLNDGKPFIGLSQFSIQHLLPSTIFLCLRQNSIIFYRLQRYIDQFKLLLKDKNYQNIIQFIDKIGLIECQVMCLLIMIDYDNDDQNNDDNNDDNISNEAYKLFITSINNITPINKSRYYTKIRMSINKNIINIFMFITYIKTNLVINNLYIKY